METTAMKRKHNDLDPDDDACLVWNALIVLGMGLGMGLLAWLMN